MFITQQISPMQLTCATDTGDAAVSNTRHPGSWPSGLERLTVDKYTPMFNEKCAKLYREKELKVVSKDDEGVKYSWGRSSTGDLSEKGQQGLPC